MVLCMKRWVGKVAVVTGASAGIGAGIAKSLVENGMIVVGLARRKHLIEQLAKTIPGGEGKLHAVKCDLSNEKEITDAFNWITESIGPVHVLVNNAGVLQKTNLFNGDTSMWRHVLDVNVLGLSIATREAIRIMTAHNIDGHIFHINSVAGHIIPRNLPNLNMYGASKHAITALAETLRYELIDQNSKIKITSISPGATESEIMQVSSMEDTSLNEVFMHHKVLVPEDIGDSVIYALSTPPHVQVKELIIKPMNEMF